MSAAAFALFHQPRPRKCVVCGCSLPVGRSKTCGGNCSEQRQREQSARWAADNADYRKNYGQQWREANRKEIKARDRIYQAKALAAIREFRNLTSDGQSPQADAETIRKREWRKNNMERKRKADWLWAKNNPDKIRASQQRSGRRRRAIARAFRELQIT